MRWGRDNRTCAFRVVGHGPSLRLENRIPGGDVNPYLATAAVDRGRAGRHRATSCELEPAFEGNAYGDPDAEHVPASLAEALDLWRGSAFARTTFGDDVVDHYANMAARRAGGLRRGRSPTGSGSGGSSDCERHRRLRPQPRSTSSTPPPRRSLTHRRAGRRRRDRRRGRAGALRAFQTWRSGGARPTGPGCCAASPSRWTRTSRSSRSSRCATPGTRSATPAGRRATSATSSTYYSAAPERLFGRQIPVAGGVDITFHEPLGVVGVIVPWNFPMPIAGWAIRARRWPRATPSSSSRPS